MAEKRVKRRLAAIMAADVVGFTRLMEADEAGTLARLNALREEVVDPLIAAHSGRMVKLMGDGALVEFASAVDAVGCAIAIQKSVDAHHSGQPQDGLIRFRIGINVGEIIVEGDDIYGNGVNLASRLEGLAEAGGICISRVAADQVQGRIDSAIEALGERSVKNIARPVEVFRIVTDGDHAPVQAAAVSDRPSIAVLAFNNMSGDAEQEYFSDGISEDIITDLSKLSELHVIARNSSFVYKEKSVSIPEVARALDVRYVLEGSVRKAGNRVRVTAQLIDATTGGHVWADRFDRDLTDIFAVQDELTREIVGALKLSLTHDEQDRLARKRNVDIEAYNLYLRGREQTFLHTRAGNIAARDLLGRVIAIDAQYAAAHAHISFTHVIDFINAWSEDPEQSLRTGVEIAERAVAMDDTEPQCHFALAGACLWNRDLDRAAAEAARCLALEPSSAEGHIATAHIQIFAGQPAAAIDTIDAYMRLDPLYPDIALFFLAEARISLGQFDRAIDALNQRLARNPESETTYSLLASCYGHLGQLDQARTAWDKARRLDPGFSVERRRRILPFRDPADLERRIEGFRKAGLID
jgi:adenylate cyclase